MTDSIECRFRAHQCDCIADPEPEIIVWTRAGFWGAASAAVLAFGSASIFAAMTLFLMWFSS